MDLQTFLKSKTGTVVLALALVLVVFVSARLWVQKREVDREIRSLEERAEQIRKDNQELSQLINYLNTDEYKEKAAREKLNLRKDGEQVVALPKDAEYEQNQQSQNKQVTNRQKWFKYFFGVN